MSDQSDKCASVALPEYGDVNASQMFAIMQLYAPELTVERLVAIRDIVVGQEPINDKMRKIELWLSVPPKTRATAFAKLFGCKVSSVTKTHSWRKHRLRHGLKYTPPKTATPKSGHSAARRPRPDNTAL